MTHNPDLSTEVHDLIGLSESSSSNTSGTTVVTKAKTALSVYAAHNAVHADGGYHPLPVGDGTQYPPIGDWARFCKLMPSEAERNLWSRIRGAGICLAMGTPIDDEFQVIAVDIDVDGDDYDILVDSIPASPMEKFGSKGITRLYRAPKSIQTMRLSRMDGERLVEILAYGTQIVLPPTMHPKVNRPYLLTGHFVAAADLPLFLQHDVERLKDTAGAVGWDGKIGNERKQASKKQRPDFEDVFAEFFWDFGAHALAHMDDWFPELGMYKAKRHRNGAWQAVNTLRGSSTGQVQEKRKPNLKLHWSGIRDMGTGEGYSPARLVSEVLGINKPEASAWLHERIGDDPWVEENAAFFALPEPTSSVIEQADGSLVDTESGEVVWHPRGRHSVLATKEPIVANDNLGDDMEVPAHLLNPPGLVGEAMKWIVDTARSPSPVLALGAALVTVGTVSGRRDAGPTDSGTALYVLGIGMSGIGKQHPLDQIQRLMEAAGAGDCLGTSEFMSATSVVKEVEAKPLSVCPMDEFGAFLKRINHKKAGTHDLGISKMLRQMWTMPFAPYRTPAWANSPSSVVHSPALSIFGVSTPKEFHDALTGGDIENGTLARFLVLPTAELPDDQTPLLNKHVVPERLAEGLKVLYSARGRGFPLQEGDGPVVPQPVPWGHGAEVIYKDFRADLLARRRSNPELDELFGRTAEMAVRLATIVAVGRDIEDPVVTADDITWGRDLADFASKRLVSDVKKYVSDTEAGARWAKVTNVLERHGGRASYATVMRLVKFGRREMQEVTDSMHDAGLADIVKVARADGKAGRNAREIILLGS